MSPSTERQVLTLRSLADRSEPVVDLFASSTFVVFFVLLCSNTVGVGPATRLPGGGVFPDARVHLGDGGARDEEVTRGDLVRGVFRRGGETAGDGDGGNNFPLT